VWVEVDAASKVKEVEEDGGEGWEGFRNGGLWVRGYCDVERVEEFTRGLLVVLV